MEGLLSREHYSYKIQTLLMKSSAYPPTPSIDNPVFKITASQRSLTLVTVFVTAEKLRSMITMTANT